MQIFMQRDAPAFLLVQLVAHDFGELLELALGLGVVRFDHDVLEVPEAPAEVLEPLALLEVASDLCADLSTHTCGCQRRDECEE